jgi:hypothetical protein
MLSIMENGSMFDHTVDHCLSPSLLRNTCVLQLDLFINGVEFQVIVLRFLILCFVIKPSCETCTNINTSQQERGVTDEWVTKELNKRNYLRWHGWS